MNSKKTGHQAKVRERSERRGERSGNNLLIQEESRKRHSADARRGAYFEQCISTDTNITEKMSRLPEGGRNLHSPFLSYKLTSNLCPREWKWVEQTRAQNKCAEREEKKREREREREKMKAGLWIHWCMSFNLLEVHLIHEWRMEKKKKKKTKQNNKRGTSKWV